MRPSLYGQYLARSKCETTLLPFPYLKGHFSAFKSFIDAVSHVNKCVIILVAIEILIVIIRQHRLAKVILLNTQNICLYVQIKTYSFTVLEFIRQPIRKGEKILHALSGMSKRQRIFSMEMDQQSCLDHKFCSEKSPISIRTFCLAILQVFKISIRYQGIHSITLWLDFSINYHSAIYFH